MPQRAYPGASPAHRCAAGVRLSKPCAPWNNELRPRAWESPTQRSAVWCPSRCCPVRHPCIRRTDPPLPWSFRRPARLRSCSWSSARDRDRSRPPPCSPSTGRHLRCRRRARKMARSYLRAPSLACRCAGMSDSWYREAMTRSCRLGRKLSRRRRHRPGCWWLLPLPARNRRIRLSWRHSRSDWQRRAAPWCSDWARARRRPRPRACPWNPLRFWCRHLSRSRS